MFPHFSIKVGPCAVCGCDTYDAVCSMCVRMLKFIDQDMHMAAKRTFIWYCPLCGNLFYDTAESCKCLSVWQAVELDMTPITNVRVWWDASVSAYRMTSPFNRELVDAVKAFIPVSDRSYDPATKVWTFVERQLGPVQQLFARLNIKPTVVTRVQVEAAAQPKSNSNIASSAKRPLDTVIIEFVRLLPYEAAKTAYRKAALTLHSDVVGGDAVKMTALNDAWARLEKEVYGQ